MYTVSTLPTKRGEMFLNNDYLALRFTERAFVFQVLGEIE